MNQQELESLQRVQLTIMDEIHKLCVNNNLRYYLIGGSALGAIRHKGFIPWDVDIDIAMPRPDYELFITQYCKQINPRFSVIDYRDEKNYYPPHALVILNNSVLVQEINELNPKCQIMAFTLMYFRWILHQIIHNKGARKNVILLELGISKRKKCHLFIQKTQNIGLS